MTKSRATKDQIVDAALETLKEEGFAGATSRAIARRGAFNQALVFYYFGTLDNLLLAALDATGEARLARYREVVGEGKPRPASPGPPPTAGSWARTSRSRSCCAPSPPSTARTVRPAT